MREEKENGEELTELQLDDEFFDDDSPAVFEAIPRMSSPSLGDEDDEDEYNYDDEEESEEEDFDEDL